MFAKRRKAQAASELIRAQQATHWGVATFWDHKGRNAAKWKKIQRDLTRESHQSRGLTGAALEAAVMGLALADPSLVKIEARA